jgi:hypothetical protein
MGPMILDSGTSAELLKIKNENAALTAILTIDCKFFITFSSEFPLNTY